MTFSVRHQLSDACPGFLKRIADQNAFSQRQAGGLKNDRHFRRLKISERFFGIVEDLIGSCRDPVFFHKILGKSLTAFDYGRIHRRSEDSESFRLKCVDNAGTERIIHTAHCQVDLLARGKIRERIEIHRSDRNALRDLRDSRITGRTVQFIYLRAPSERFRDRVLSSAASNQ